MSADVEISPDMEDSWREQNSRVLKLDRVPPDFPAGGLRTSYLGVL
jgi:hypothetical protein